MDTNMTLHEARELVAVSHDLDLDYAWAYARLASLVDELDRAMSQGAELPDAWKENRR